MGSPTNTGLRTNIPHRSNGHHTNDLRASNGRGHRHASRSDLRRSGDTRRNGRRGILPREILRHYDLYRRGRKRLVR